MNTPQTTIRRLGKAQRPAGFERLRAQGIELLQQTSGATWTDHNLHDPGITILEALCYALTETAFRSEFPVEDLLTGADHRIAFEGLSLHPPHEALPCGATTAADHVGRLLDRVDGLDDVRLTRAVGQPAGVLTMWLKLSEGRPDEQAQRCRNTLAAYRAERGLGEDVDPKAQPVTRLRYVLEAEIEIYGPHEGAEVLADIYNHAAAYIDGVARRQTRRQLRDQGQALEQIYDGPVVQRGFMGQTAGELDPLAKLYISDLARHLKDSTPAIKEVQRLCLVRVRGQGEEQGQGESLSPGDDIVTDSLPWRGADSAPSLCVPGQADEQAVRVKLHRRRQPIAVDIAELRHRVQDLQAADRARRKLQQEAGAEAEKADLPTGRYRPAGNYRSIQHDFPAIYGLGRHGVPPGAGAQRAAQARQLSAYLLLFEQVLANSRAQTDHLAELFSGAGARRKTYWWEALNRVLAPVQGEPASTLVPGAGVALIGTPADLEREVLAPMDEAAPRRHKLLDHLLALHGEDFSQNAMRLYCSHLDADDIDALLLDTKAAFLTEVVQLSRYRARGYDYSRPLWAGRGNLNYSGLARRVCLLLGFAFRHARSLTRPVLHKKLVLVGGPLGRQQLPRGVAEDSAALALRRPGGDQRRCRTLLAALGVQPDVALSRRLLRSGAAHDGYRLVRAAGPADPAPDTDGPTTLALHDAEASQWWALHTYPSRADAVEAACALREAMLKLSNACEGLHLVEHLLLRPLVDPAIDPLWPLQTSGFFDLRLTAVLPNWTVRTHQHGFRLLAEETLLINCPAHLELQVLWLDFDRMCAFEADYAAWLKARRAHCLAPGVAGHFDAARVDSAALGVIRHLLPVVDRPVPAVGGVLGCEEDG